jgi:hypothetical protein
MAESVVVNSIMRETKERLENGDRAKLTIIARNAAPIREDFYPFLWMVNSGGQATRVDVRRDRALQPHVEEKRICG